MFYYVIQVATGNESDFINDLKRLEPELSKNYSFIYLTRELTIRRQGKWRKETLPLFASYIFVEAAGEIPALAVQKLKKIPGFYHFLNSNVDIVPLSGSDLSILQHFMGIGSKIGASLVKFDENDRIVVIEGPLKGLEGNIIKVDRRKQRAKIRIDLKGFTHTMIQSAKVEEVEINEKSALYIADATGNKPYI